MFAGIGAWCAIPIVGLLLIAVNQIPRVDISYDTCVRLSESVAPRVGAVAGLGAYVVWVATV